MGSSLLLHEYKDMLGRYLHLILITHPPKLLQKSQITQNIPNLLYLQTKDMQAEVEIGQQRSARQFAADTLNPRCMTTLAFFRVVRKMIVVSRKLRLCPKTVTLAVCMCVPKVRLNVIFTRIHNPCHILFTPPFPLKLFRIAIYCAKCSLQGIPLAFVLTGWWPSTTIESLTLIESHNITKLHDPDFRHINQNAYPVVFAYNGRDHFAPTIPCTTAQLLEWKTKKKLGSLLGASLHVSTQLDQHTLPTELSAAYKEVQAYITRNLPVIS